MTVGRPSSFTQETADTICDRLCAGESLRKICCDEAMPDQATVYRWLRTNDAFREQYTRAREIQADTLFDETLDISDDGSNDWMEDKEKADGFRYNGDAVQRSRLRIDTRKWMAGKLAPKKYGEKVDLNVTGGLTVTKASELTDDELAKMAQGK